MPTKIKLLLTFLVVLISSYIFFEHFIARHFLKATIILVISILMIFGLWILPEAKGKLREQNEK